MDIFYSVTTTALQPWLYWTSC